MPLDNPLGGGVCKKNHSSQQRVGDGRKLEVEMGIHKNGFFREEEKMVHECVIGMLPSVSKESIVRSVHAGKALYKEGCTVVFKGEGSDKVVIGPYVC